MTIETDNEVFGLDRKTAGRLLKVSIRTIDRYIKSKKLSTNVVDGRVWLSKKELEGVREEKNRKTTIHRVDMSTPVMSMDNEVDNMDSVELIDQGGVDSVSTKTRKRKTANAVYKKLYLDQKEELHEKQERLEIANYRVGQLEAQVKNSIPMLEYHQERYEVEKREKSLQTKIDEQNSVIKKISTVMKYEKFNKRIFLGILLIILALQPLWLLFVYK
jgi:vacuolar-type H+-ATPase subunit I/STV1